jgi:hypothetical protein
MPDFKDKVSKAWSMGTLENCNHLATLHINLSRTTKVLNTWSKTLFPQGKITMAISREVVDQLEKAQELRQLTLEECGIIKHLKRHTSWIGCH